MKAMWAVRRRTIAWFVEAVLFRFRAGIPWRDLPERFGEKTVYQRFNGEGTIDLGGVGMATTLFFEVIVDLGAAEPDSCSIFMPEKLARSGGRHRQERIRHKPKFTPGLEAVRAQEVRSHDSSPRGANSYIC